jgi:hypothetical protein
MSNTKFYTMLAIGIVLLIVVSLIDYRTPSKPVAPVKHWVGTYCNAGPRQYCDYRGGKGGTCPLTVYLSRWPDELGKLKKESCEVQ